MCSFKTEQRASAKMMLRVSIQHKVFSWLWHRRQCAPLIGGKLVEASSLLLFSYIKKLSIIMFSLFQNTDFRLKLCGLCETYLCVCAAGGVQIAAQSYTFFWKHERDFKEKKASESQPFKYICVFYHCVKEFLKGNSCIPAQVIQFCDVGTCAHMMPCDPQGEKS